MEVEEFLAPVATVTLEVEGEEVAHIAFFLSLDNDAIVAVGVANPAEAERYAAVCQEAAFSLRNASFVSPPSKDAGAEGFGEGWEDIPF